MMLLCTATSHHYAITSAPLYKGDNHLCVYASCMQYNSGMRSTKLGTRGRGMTSKSD